MRLRSKIFLILISVVALFSSIEHVILKFAVFPGFAELEREEAQKDLGRAVSAIDREIHHLDRFCWDWSSWDDTYDFILSGSKEYIASNLPLTTFTDNGINLICYLNLEGKVIWGKIYDLETEEEMAVSEFPNKAFPKSHPVTAFPTGGIPVQDMGTAGLFMTEQGPMLIASHPISTSDNQGPIRGVVVMGRFLNKDVVKTLVEQTQVSFELFDIRYHSRHEIHQEITDRLIGGSQYLIQEKSPDHLLVYTIYPDIKGDPAILLRAEIPRKISVKGYKTLYHAQVFILISMTALFMAILFFLQQTVLRPIAELKSHVLSIGETGDFSARLPRWQNDEIGMLGSEFDRMMERLEKRATALSLTNMRLHNEISDRKQAEQALRESELRYRSFIENFHGIAYQGTLPRTLTFVHGAVEAITGYTEEMFLLGKIRWDKLVHPDDLPKILECNDEAKVSPEYATEREFRIIRKDGQVRWLHEFFRSVHNSSGKQIHIQGVLYDITDKKKIEQRLFQAQKMEAIGTLAGGVAHEFNNILMTILMNTEFGLKKLPQDSSLRESFKMALNAAYRARDLVEQIITFSRTGSEELHPLTIAPIVKESLKILESALPANIEISSQIDATSGTVLASPAMINSILHNLYSNAEYAMRESGGRLTVSLAEEVLDTKSQGFPSEIGCGPYIRLSISDTGKGIPKDIIKRIFDPFFTTKRSGEGPGMGLSVVRGIVESLGGTIRVRSEPGKGTDFDLYLPMIEDEATPSGQLCLQPRDLQKKILVVDDDESLIAILDEILCDFGCQVVGIKDSSEALNLFRETPERFDLVITDQTLPHMTGTTMAQGMLDIRPDIPIILFSGFIEPAIQAQATALGIREVIRKPVDIATISKTVCRILNIKRVTKNEKLKDGKNFNR